MEIVDSRDGCSGCSSGLLLTSALGWSISWASLVKTAVVVDVGFFLVSRVWNWVVFSFFFFPKVVLWGWEYGG